MSNKPQFKCIYCKRELRRIHEDCETGQVDDGLAFFASEMNYGSCVFDRTFESKYEYKYKDENIRYKSFRSLVIHLCDNCIIENGKENLVNLHLIVKPLDKHEEIFPGLPFLDEKIE